MAQAEAAGQARVVEIAAELETLSGRLLTLHDSFPVSHLEAAMLLGEEEMDVFTALRSVIECVLTDRLEPALQGLRKWAVYQPKPTKDRR